MANVSYLRTPIGARRSGEDAGRSPLLSGRRRRGPYIAGGVALAVVAILAAGAIIFASAKASLSSDPVAIAKIGMPLGGGSVQSVSVNGGPHGGSDIPATVRGGRIYPSKLVPANEQLTVSVIVKRPGWIAWVAGHTQHLTLRLTTPVASLRGHYLTIGAHAPLRLRFKHPIEVIATGGSPAHLTRQVLGSPRATITLPHAGIAGTVFVAAAPRRWETSKASAVSWFPPGKSASAVASPAPGGQIKPSTPITLNFSKPVSAVLGSQRPVISPSTAGRWRVLTPHSIQFVPEGYGYGLGAKVSIGMPNGVRLVGQTGTGSGDATWTVPGGSTVRLQQLLAMLGYLPLHFDYTGGTGVGLSEAAQEAAAIDPPKGHFSWRYPNTPSALRGDWKIGSYGVVMQGAIMAFENAHGMTPDGQPGPAVWKALISDAIQGKHSTFGYTWVDVSKASQSLSLWHSGKVVLTTPVNTGVAGAPTASGTFPVFEHLTSTTMSGTNPDGSHYSDPGIPWVSYFNGGDALHGFVRGSYGSPQSDGCVEMPISTAAQVYPYTPIGTIVHVT